LVSLRSLSRIVWLLIAICAVAVFFGNLRFGRQVLAIGLEDDFFYYAQAARNVVGLGSSTFDGMHLTNGYHPLWMLLLVVLTWLARLCGGSVYAFAIGLETLQLAVVLATAYFGYQLARRFCGVMTSICIQLVLASWALVLARSGMEASLTVASCLGLLLYRLREEFSWSPRSSFGYAMLASVVVLSRLDSVLFVLLLILFGRASERKECREGVLSSGSMAGCPLSGD
jgi:hypothetical protein